MKNQRSTYIFAFLLFGLAMGVIDFFQTRSVRVGLVMGLFSGAVFTGFILIFVYAVRRFRAFGMKEVDGWAPGEAILRSGDANMMRHGFAEGGRLFLTSMRIRFCAHRAGLEVGDLSFPIGGIVSVERCRTLGIVPNGLRVALADGRKVQFVVQSPHEWIDAITSASTPKARGTLP